jgi:predicted protein tyrosine phosphatase
MKIEIMSHKEALNALEANPNSINLIFISSPAPNTYMVAGSDKIESLAKTCCALLFNDTNTESKPSSPKKDDVQKALEFAKGKDSVLVTCQAGVSRSAAIAYLIAIQESDVKYAFSILDHNIHKPNKLIIKHGAYILNRQDIIRLIHRWKEDGTFYF